nr:LFchimera [synthetic construct]
MDLIRKLLSKAQEKFGKNKSRKGLKKMRWQWRRCKFHHHHHHKDEL